MSKPFFFLKPLPRLSLWERMEQKRKVLYFELEVTARCNNNCRHCCINLPAFDQKAKGKELSLKEIKSIVDEAASLGALWCLITGGEPLLRNDFFDIYLYLKKKGILVSVFTNATLITREHIRLFKKYPPRDIEITVYGITEKTYGRLTRNPSCFPLFLRGLELLLKNKIKVRLKAIAMRSNLAEFPEIARFCQARTKDYFRYDPFLHLRFDRNQKRNKEIKSERLSAEEIATLEKNDPERLQVLKKNCAKFINAEFADKNSRHIFFCGAGKGSFTIAYNGLFRLCATLWHPDCIYDLRKGSLSEAWYSFVPKVIDMRSQKESFLKKCRFCRLTDLCSWCPGHDYLETGKMDVFVDYFCEVAYARASNLFLNSASIKTP